MLARMFDHRARRLRDGLIGLLIGMRVGYLHGNQPFSMIPPFATWGINFLLDGGRRGFYGTLDITVVTMLAYTAGYHIGISLNAVPISDFQADNETAHYRQPRMRVLS